MNAINPYTVGATIFILLAFVSIYLYLRRHPGQGASAKSVTKPVTPMSASAKEPRSVTIGETVRYRRRRSLFSRNARVTGFTRARRGHMLISLADRLGNRFSVVNSRIL